MCSNDAKSCFDQIVHAVFSLCLQRIGCPTNAIEGCIKTLQNMEHHIRTAFGDSQQCYSGKQNKPLQGIIQGYDPALAGWVLVSIPIINMMRNGGFGFKQWSSISREVLHMVCFSFVDDTDLVQAADTPETEWTVVKDRMQGQVDHWEGGRATGGAL